MVGLQPAKGDHLSHPALLRSLMCRGQQVFQFAGLISTQTRTEIIIALDEDLTL
jgi:hypothetical protein